MSTLRELRPDASRPASRGELDPPALPSDYVSRSRLFASLERELGERLTLLTAPAGYGKSTVLSAWTRASDRVMAWLSLTEPEAVLTGFLNGLVAAVQQRYPDFDRAVLNFLTLPDLPPAWFMADELGRELAALPGELVIVLDDYHVVADPMVHATLVKLLERLPENVRLVVPSRTEPPLRLGLFRARGQLLELRTTQLQFQAEEAATFLARAGGRELANEVTAAIHQRTEGWAAGLRLTALALGDQTDPAAWVERFQHGSARSVRQFLLDEVIGRQSPEAQIFLLRSSICKRFSAELCDALLVGSDPLRPSRAVLDEFERSELMLVPLDDASVWFRYHHLFQAALQQHLASRCAATEIATLHHQAGAWFASAGLVDEAVHHLLAAGDVDTAAELVERHRVAALVEQAWPHLERWLNLLPPAVVARRPGLLLARAWIQHFRYQTALMSQNLEAFDRRIAAGDGPPDLSAQAALLGEADALWAQLEIFQLNSRVALERGQQALTRLPLAAGTLRSHARFPILLARHVLGDHAGAVTFAESELAADPSDIRLLGGLGWIQILDGAIPEAVQALSQSLAAAEADHRWLIVGWAHYLLGWVAYQRNDLIAARDHFLAVDRLRDTAHLLPLREATLGLARTLWALGDEAARVTVDDFVQLAMQTLRSSDVASARACLARLSFEAGDTAGVLEWLQSTSPLPPVLPLPDMECPALTRARLLIGLGIEQGLDDAERLLGATAAQFAAIRNLPGGVATQATQALLHQARGDTGAALVVLGQAIDTARPSGLLRIFVDLGPPLRDLLLALHQQTGPDSYIDELLGAFLTTSSLQVLSASPQRESPVTPGLVEGLTWREQETLRLLDGRLSNKEIAAKLAISTETVKKHTSHIYQKLQVGSRRAAVARARALGLLDR